MGALRQWMRQMLRLRKRHWQRQQMRSTQPLSIVTVTVGRKPAVAPMATAIIMERQVTRDQGRTTAPRATPAAEAIIMKRRTPIHTIQAHGTTPGRTQAVSTTSTTTTRVVGPKEDEGE